MLQISAEIFSAEIFSYWNFFRRFFWLNCDLNSLKKHLLGIIGHWKCCPKFIPPKFFPAEFFSAEIVNSCPKFFRRSFSAEIFSDEIFGI